MDARDDAFLQMIAGATFGGKVVLPSGVVISGGEATAMASYYAASSACPTCGHIPGPVNGEEG